MKIIVLAGGLSPERDVSLSSGSLIANALIENGHHVLLLDLYKGIECGSSYDDLFVNLSHNQKYNFTVPMNEPNLEQLKLENGNGNVLIGNNVIELCRHADLVFIALHGDIGENGKLQAIFDSYDITYTGTGYIGSLLAMDKDIAKKMMLNGNISTPDWILYDTKNNGTSKAVNEIGFPCVVKPCSCGSSVGVSIAGNIDEFNHAVKEARRYEAFIMVEKMIEGREFSAGILNNQPLPIIEIIPNKGFYDYANKYQKGYTTEICPARLSDELSAKMQSTALEVHNTLRLGAYSRIDFILSKENKIYCLEANTLPGMTPTSLLPQEAAAAGISYNELCDMIVKTALCTKKI